MIEAALFLPIVLALLIGTEELARVTYTYYMIQKILSDVALTLGTQVGINFCNSGDPLLVAAINNALTGTADGSGDPLVVGLTPDMVTVTIARYDPISAGLTPCDCSAAGCDASQGGTPPNFIVVSLANGYQVHPLFWGFNIDPFPLQPSVTAPYYGT
jgi:hypothetical protein